MCSAHLQMKEAHWSHSCATLALAQAPRRLVICCRSHPARRMEDAFGVKGFTPPAPAVHVLSCPLMSIVFSLNRWNSSQFRVNVALEKVVAQEHSFDIRAILARIFNWLEHHKRICCGEFIELLFPYIWSSATRSEHAFSKAGFALFNTLSVVLGTPDTICRSRHRGAGGVRTLTGEARPREIAAQLQCRRRSSNNTVATGALKFSRFR